MRLQGATDQLIISIYHLSVPVSVLDDKVFLVMIIGLVEASISLPDARSLKDKRMIVRSMKDRALNRMNVSVAEVGHQDTWRRADLAFVTVAAEKSVVEKRLAEISDFLRSDPRHVLIDYHMEFL